MLETRELERLVTQSGDRAYRFAYALCGNDPEARELVQDAFTRVFERAEQYDCALSLETWFLTILKRIYFDRRRYCARRRSLSLDSPIGDGGLTISDTIADPQEIAMLDRLERDEEVGRVRQALTEIPVDSRTILMMVDVEGMTYENAAQVLGCPLGTVRSRMSRARQMLRRRLLGTGVAK